MYFNLIHEHEGAVLSYSIYLLIHVQFFNSIHHILTLEHCIKMYELITLMRFAAFTF